MIFPYYDSKHFPGRDFIFKILSTLQNSEIKTLIKKSREVWFLVKITENTELIVLQEDLLIENENFLAHRSSLNYYLCLI